LRDVAQDAGDEVELFSTNRPQRCNTPTTKLPSGLPIRAASAALLRWRMEQPCATPRIHPTVSTRRLASPAKIGS